MGFRDLKAFNLAMLAKQGWRMVLGNDSLLYKCFKARYFPRSNFLEAKESPNCLFVWRSLMAAMPILQSGHCLRVGNGVSINALKDKWLPNFPTNKVLNPILPWEGLFFPSCRFSPSCVAIFIVFQVDFVGLEGCVSLWMASWRSSHPQKPLR